jgi:TetR/AcrR family transcriptional regulator, regulator of mycofactocin system
VPPRPLTQRMSDKRSELLVAELERISLGLFGRCGFASVTVEDIAADAGISIRTFYRYLKTKDDVMLVRIRRRAQMLQEILADRPLYESPLRSIRIASEITSSREDPDLVMQWITTAAASPPVTQSILGAIHLYMQPVLAEFLRSRLGLPEDPFTPKMLAAAVGGVVQEAHSHWFAHGGDLGEIISRGLWVLESGLAISEPAASPDHRGGANRRKSTKRTARSSPRTGVESPIKEKGKQK